MTQREFIQNHKPLKFKFYQNEEDFIVEENPIKFSGRGNFIIMKIKKRRLELGNYLILLLEVSKFMKMNLDMLV